MMAPRVRPPVSPGFGIIRCFASISCGLILGPALSYVSDEINRNLCASCVRDLGSVCPTPTTARTITKDPAWLRVNSVLKGH